VPAPGEPPEKRKLPRVAAAAGAVALLAALGSLILVAPQNTPREPARPALERNRVVVLPFENRTGESGLDRLGVMAADWIAQGLAETGIVRAVSTTGLEPLETVEGLQPPAASATALAEATRSAIAVHGSFHRQGDSIAFRAQVTDAATGELVRAISGITATPETPLAAVETLRQRTTGALATVLDPLLESWAMAASQPPSYQAYELYAEGLEVFFNAPDEQEERSAEMRVALDYFHRAAALDSSFVVPLLWALYAYANAGDRSAWDSLAQVLDGRRDRLTRWERAVLNAHLAHLRDDLRGVYRAYSRIVEMTPGAEWNYKLGSAALDLNRPQEAVDLLSEIEPEKGWLAHWDSYWARLAAARHELGDHARELEDARRHPDPEDALWLEQRALVGLGRIEEAKERTRSAVPQDRISAVYALAEELHSHGHQEAARQVIEDYVASADTEVAGERSAWTAYRTAQMLELAGRVSEARSLVQESAREWPDLEMTWNAYLGVLAAKASDRGEALKHSSWLANLEEPSREGLVAWWRAKIAAQLGDRQQAVQLLMKAHDAGFPLPTVNPHDIHLDPLRDYPPFVELVRPKG
jgi:tetratricopeptide (TPR) repeat protein/TolB-like protein